jgi:hypothetical protein
MQSEVDCDEVASSQERVTELSCEMGTTPGTRHTREQRVSSTVALVRGTSRDVRRRRRGPAL